MARLPALAFITALLCTGGASGHDHWINHGGYRSPQDGSLCCGEGDCFLVAEDGVRLTLAGYVLQNGEVVPFAEALLSEDGRYWRCRKPNGSRRCFFAPRGGA
jgi:hypothetical protein